MRRSHYYFEHKLDTADDDDDSSSSRHEQQHLEPYLKQCSQQPQSTIHDPTSFLHRQGKSPKQNKTTLGNRCHISPSVRCPVSVLHVIVWMCLLAVSAASATVSGTSGAKCNPCENPDWFLCEKSCTCIPQKHRCDGHYADCGLQDFSDEKNCSDELLLRSCGKLSELNFPCYDTRKAFLFDSNGVKNETVAAQVESRQVEDNGYCVQAFYWACDGTIQCKKSLLDEDSKVCARCPQGWLKCGDQKKCVPEKRQCDGVDDCGNGFDEQNCVCKGLIQSCGSSGPISSKYLGCGSFDRCNAVHPCFPHLSNHESRTYCLSKGGYQRRCSEKEGYHQCFDDMGLMRCIAENLVCDGISHCANATDENPNMCYNKKATTKVSTNDCYGVCDHVCSSMSSISNNAVPFSPALVPFPSDSPSSSSLPNHQCSCSPGFSLSTHDKFSCIAQDKPGNQDSFLDQPGALLLAAGARLEALHLDSSYFIIRYSNKPSNQGSKFSSSSSSSSSSSLNHVNNNRPMTSSADEDDNSQHSKHIAGYLSRSSPLAVHVDKKLAFVVDVSGTKILGLQIDGKSHCSIEVGNKIGGLAVDWVHDLIFWTEPLRNSIKLASLDGTKVRLIYSNLNRPTCIVAFPSSASLFVCESPVVHGRIIRLPMDGEGPPIEMVSWSDPRWLKLLPNSLRNLRVFEKPDAPEIRSPFTLFSPVSLAVDYTNQVLYFVENYFSVVAGLELNPKARIRTNASTGGGQIFLLTPEWQFVNQKLFGIEVFNNRLYVSEVRSKIVYQLYPLSSRMNVSHPEGILTGHSVNLSIDQSYSMDLKIMHSSRQPIREGDNHCPITHRCSYLCLPSYSSYKCVCPKGYRLVFNTECELIIDPFLLYGTSQGIFKAELPLTETPVSSLLINITSLLSDDNIPESKRSSLASKGPADIDWHPGTNKIFWTVPEAGSIFCASHDGSRATLLLSNLGKPWGIAVDYVTNKVFWSDIERSAISAVTVADDVSVTSPDDVVVLVWMDLSSPNYVALDLMQGYLYWADSGKPYRIERSQMDGGGRKTIKSVQFLPSKLLIDLSTFIYFLAGQQIHVVTNYSISSQTFNFERLCCDDFSLQGDTFDIFNQSIFTVSESTILQCAISQLKSNSKNSYITSPQEKPMNAYNSAVPQLNPVYTCQRFQPQMNSSNTLPNSDSLSANHIRSVSVFHQKRPKTNRQFCVNEKGQSICEHVCFLAPDSSGTPEDDKSSRTWVSASPQPRPPLCSCLFGYQPNPVNHTRCIPRTDDVLLISSGSKLEIVFYSQSHMTQYPQLSKITPKTNSLDQWEYNPLSRTLIYYDASRQLMVEADLQTGNFVKEFLFNANVKSFAIDPTHSLIFYVSENSSINMCPIEKCDQHDFTRRLVTKNISKPRSLTVDANLGLLFWVDYITEIEIVDQGESSHDQVSESGSEYNSNAANEEKTEIETREVTYVYLNQISMSGDPRTRRVLVRFPLDIGAQYQSSHHSSDEKSPFSSAEITLSIDVANQKVNYVDMKGIVTRVSYYSPVETQQDYGSGGGANGFVSSKGYPSVVEQTVSLDEREFSAGGLAALNGELFWVERRRRVIGMYDRFHLTTSLNGNSFLLNNGSTISKIAAYSHKDSATNQCKKMLCSFICVPTHTGRGQCLCPLGVWLSPDNETCESAPKQFILTPNSVLLPEVTMPPTLHSSNSAVQLKDVASFLQQTSYFSCQPTQYSSEIGAPLAIDFHYDHQLIFVATINGIYQFDFNLKNLMIVRKFRPSSGESLVLGLAVDWISDNLYWLSAEGLFVSRLDGASTKRLRTFKVQNGRGGLAIYPNKSLMFWSHPAIRAGIHRSYLNADQEDDENIWNSDSYSGNPDHMAIDHEKRQIYWLLSDKSLLFMSNFDGSGLLSFPSLFKRPVALTVLADITYCIDLSTGSPSTGSATTSQGPHLSLTQCNLKGIREASEQQQSSLLRSYMVDGVNFTQLDNLSLSHFSEGGHTNLTELNLNALNISNMNEVEPLNPQTTCSSVETCYMDYQSSTQFAALVFVSPAHQMRSTGGGSKPTHPCMINNGGCEYLCLPKRFGHVCACPDPDNSYLPSSYNTQGAIRGASDAYPYHKSAGVVCSQMEFPRNNKTAVTTTTSPVFGPHGNFPPNDSTDLQEQIQMVLIIVVCAAAVISLSIVLLVVCIKKYQPNSLVYHSHNTAANTFQRQHPLAAQASLGAPFLTPRVGAFAGPPLPGQMTAINTPRGTMYVGGPRAPAATAFVHHNAVSGNIYHSLPRRSRCSLAADNYVLPQNTRRYSTHSLQRNARYAVGGGASNYFDLQSHLLSIPTGPAGAAAAQAQATGVASTSTSATSPLCHAGPLWTPVHTSNGGSSAGSTVYNYSTLSNKNLSKAAINHFTQMQLQQHQQQSSTGGGSSIAHSPSASFSSQGSRNTGGSSLHLGGQGLTPGSGAAAGSNIHSNTGVAATVSTNNTQLASLTQSRSSLIGGLGLGMVRNNSSKSISNYSAAAAAAPIQPMMNIPAYMTISRQQQGMSPAALIAAAAASEYTAGAGTGGNYHSRPPFLAAAMAGGPGAPIVAMEVGDMGGGAGDCAMSQTGATTLSVSTDDSVQHRTDSSC